MSGSRSWIVACVTLVLVAAGCESGGDPSTSSSPDSSVVTTTEPFVAPQRDPYFWPHSASSVWNVGLGSDAELGGDDDPATLSLRGFGSDASPAGISYKNFTHPISLAKASDPEVEVRLADAYADASVSCFVDRGAGGNSKQSCDQSVSSVDIKMAGDLVVDPGNCLPSTPGPSCDADQGTDGSLHVVQPDGVTLYSMFRAFGGGIDWQAARIAKWNLTNDGIAEQPGQQWGTRAYGGSDVAGLMRCWELEKVVNGEWTSFPHALAIAVHGSQLKAGQSEADTFVWPATTSDSGWARYSGALPMGALISVDPDRPIDTPSLIAEAIWNTLRTNGGYVVDQTGGQFATYAEPGCDLNDALARASNAMFKVQASATVVTNNSPSSINGGGKYPQPAPTIKPLLGQPFTGTYSERTP